MKLQVLQHNIYDLCAINYSLRQTHQPQVSIHD